MRTAPFCVPRSTNFFNMAANWDSHYVTETLVHCRAILVISASECKSLVESQWKSKCVTGTAVNLIQTILNGRRRISVEIDCMIQHRTKRVTPKIFNIKSGPGTSMTDAEQHNLGSPPLLWFEGETEKDLDLIDLVTEHDALSANANAVSHRRIWSTNEAAASLKGPVTKNICKVIGPSSDIYTSGGAPRDLSPFDFFISMSLMKHLEVIKSLTNARLEKRNLQSVTTGELLRLFGLLILLTRFIVSAHRDLWKTSLKYSPTLDFGKIMSRKGLNLFYATYASVTFPSTKIQFWQSRWSLFRGFMKAINDHRQSYVYQSDHLCVDKSISQWYGLGEDWTKMGLPHHVAYTNPKMFVSSNQWHVVHLEFCSEWNWSRTTLLRRCPNSVTDTVIVRRWLWGWSNVVVLVAWCAEIRTLQQSKPPSHCGNMVWSSLTWLKCDKNNSDGAHVWAGTFVTWCSRVNEIT